MAGSIPLDAAVTRYGQPTLRFNGSAAAGIVNCDPFGGRFASTGDFTAEVDAYWDSGGATNNCCMTIGFGFTATIDVYTTPTDINLRTGAAFRFGGTKPSQGAWHHVRVTRLSNVLKLWVDGVQVGSSYTLSGTLESNAATLGGSWFASAGSNWHVGRIANFRFTDGTARDSGAAFTPPSAPYGENVTDDPLWDSVKALVKGDAIVAPNTSLINLATGVSGFAPTWPCFNIWLHVARRP
jgi:hypothetical protein